MFYIIYIFYSFQLQLNNVEIMNTDKGVKWEFIADNIGLIGGFILWFLWCENKIE